MSAYVCVFSPVWAINCPVRWSWGSLLPKRIIQNIHNALRSRAESAFNTCSVHIRVHYACIQGRGCEPPHHRGHQPQRPAYIYVGFLVFLAQIRNPYALSPVCHPVVGCVYWLVPMEQMMATLILALKEVETEHPDCKARETLIKAVNQAIKMREKWKCNWELQN